MGILKSYNKAIEIDPKNAAAWNDKGVALYRLGRYREAIKCYDIAININKEATLDKSEKYKEVIKVYDKADIDEDRNIKFKKGGMEPIK